MAYGVTSQTLSRYNATEVQNALDQQAINGQGFAEGALYIREIGSEDEVWVWTSRAGHQRVTFEAKNFRFTYKPDSPIAIGDWADDSAQTVTIARGLDYVNGERIEISYDHNNYWIAEVTSYDTSSGIIDFTITEGVAEGTDSFSIFTFDLYNPVVRNENVLSVKTLQANYTALTNQTIFSPADGDFALVTSSQGTKFLPDLISEPWRPAGLYIYNGSDEQWDYLSDTLTEGIYTAVQNQPPLQTLTSMQVSVSAGAGVYDATNMALYFNKTADRIEGVDTDTTFDTTNWQEISTGGGGGDQFDDQQALEDFITNKGDFRSDIGAQATLTAGDITLDLLEQDGATGGQLLGWNSTDSVWEPTNAAAGGDGFTTYTAFTDLPDVSSTPPAVTGDLAKVLVEGASYPAYMYFDAASGGANGEWKSAGMVIDEGNGLRIDATTRRLEMREATATQRGTVNIGDQTFGGAKTFQFSDDENDNFTVELSGGNDIFRVSSLGAQVNNGTNFEIHQGTVPETDGYDDLQRMMFVEGSGLSRDETGYVTHVDQRLYSRWSNAASGFPLPRVRTWTPSVPFNSDDSEEWQTTSPLYSLLGQSSNNGANRDIFEIRAESRGSGTGVDTRLLFNTSDNNSLGTSLSIEHDRIIPMVATVFEDKVRFDEKTTTELAALTNPLEGDVYYNTTDDLPQYYDGTNFVNFVPDANIPGWSQNDGTPINPAQINVDTTGPLTYSVSDGVITIGSTGGEDGFATSGVLNSIIDLTLTDDAAITSARNLGGELLHQGIQTDTAVADAETVVYGRIVTRVTPGDTPATGTSSYDFYISDDGEIATTRGLRIGHVSSSFGPLESEIQDRDGDLDAAIRSAYVFNTNNVQTNDFYRYNNFSAIEDTFLNDRTPGNKNPLYIGLTQGRWNLKDDSSDATNVTNLVEVRHEYNQDTDNRWGSHIISTWTGDRDSATVTQYDTAKFEPAHVIFYSGADGNTEGDVMVNHEVGNMFTVSFMDMIITGSTDIPDDSGETSNNGTDTTARPYEAYYCKDGNTYFRVERVAADETVTDATNPWWIGLINSENRFHTEQMWSTSNNDTRVLIDIRY